MTDTIPTPTNDPTGNPFPPDPQPVPTAVTVTSGPVTPLTHDEAVQVMKDATRHGYLWRIAQQIDKSFNEITGGDGNMTFSTRMAMWATQHVNGTLENTIGNAVCRMLNTISSDHGAKAELADLARAEETVRVLSATPTVEKE